MGDLLHTPETVPRGGRVFEEEPAGSDGPGDMVLRAGMPGTGDSPALEDVRRHLAGGVRALRNHRAAAGMDIRGGELLPAQHPDDRPAGGDSDLGGHAVAQPLRLPQVAL